MIAPFLLAATLLTSGPQTPPQAPPTTQVDDVIVEAQRSREAASAFVESVSEPVRGRKAAVWRDSICIGAAGLPVDASQFLVDRVSDWAASVGLAIEPPGCPADVLIVATSDGKGLAREMVASRPDEFRTGVSGSDLGAAALDDFQNSDRPVRWWQVSLPVNAWTGLPIGRLPGQLPWEPQSASITRPSDVGPMGHIALGSRLADETRDDLQQVIVVLDNSALDQASFAQIVDYIALVSLVQVDPETRPAQPSILRLFLPDEAQEDTLTRWDRAFLRAVYSAEQRRSATNANQADIAALVERELRDEAQDLEPVEP